MLDQIPEVASCMQQLGSTMEFKRSQQQEDGIGYTAPPIRPSAFSKPLLPTSSSLVSPRGLGLSGTTTTTTPAATGAFGPIATTSAANSSTSDHPPRSHGPDNDPFLIQIPSPSATGKTVAPVIASMTPTTSSSAPPEPAARYRECLRNHAASIGGHVLDGCGEFMPGGDDALKCAACGCHRSFHRKETDYGLANGLSPHHLGGRGRIPLLLPSPSQPNSHPNQPRQTQASGSFPASPLPAGFGGNYSGSGGATTESSSEERAGALARVPPQGVAASRKRFRTKFTAEQKERMLELAERVGWRIQKQDEALVERFCAEVGVTRRVLKVWMHNNKLTKRQHQKPEEQHQEQPQHPQQRHQQQQQQIFMKTLESYSP